MVLEKGKRFKPNVAYELLIDGKYHYYGSHCVNSPFIYASVVKTNSGNRLTQAVHRGEITREEYNERVQLINVWEFDTPKDAQEKERSLIDLGKLLYGAFSYNIVEGNNENPVYSDNAKERFREWARNNREFLVACGEKGIKNNPVMFKSKKVLQFKDNVFIAEYPSVSNAARSTGIERRSIRRAAYKRYKTAGGFVWEFKTDNPSQEKTGA